MRERTYKIHTSILKAARGKRGLTEVCTLLEIETGIRLTRQGLWNYENGLHDVPEDKLAGLCRVLGLNFFDVVQHQKNLAPTSITA